MSQHSIISRRHFLELSALAGAGSVLPCIPAAAIAAEPLSATPQRKWTDATGKLSIEGALLLATSDCAVIQKKDGSLTAPKLEQLSDTDKVFIRDLLVEKMGTKSGPAYFETKLYDWREMREPEFSDKDKSSMVLSILNYQSEATRNNFKSGKLPKSGTLGHISFAARPAAIIISETPDVHAKLAQIQQMREIAPARTEIPETVSSIAALLKSPMRCFFVNASFSTVEETFLRATGRGLEFNLPELRTGRRPVPESLSIMSEGGSTVSEVLLKIGMQVGRPCVTSSDGSKFLFGPNRINADVGLTVEYKVPKNLKIDEIRSLFLSSASPLVQPTQTAESRFVAVGESAFRITTDHEVHFRFSNMLSAFSALREEIGAGRIRRQQAK